MKLLASNWHRVVVSLALVFIPACSGSSDPSAPALPEVVISDETVVIDENSGISVLSIDSSSIVFNASQADPASLPFAEGDILVSGQGDGYLRRVISIEVAGDSIVVETAEADLAEVILKGDFSWSGPLQFEVSQSQQKGEIAYLHPALHVNNTHSGVISITLNGLGINLGSNARLTVREGSFVFSPYLDIGGDFDRGLKEFHAIVSGDLDFDILAEVTLSATPRVRGEIRLISGLAVGAPIVIPAAVPIVIVPEFDLFLGAEVSASGVVTMAGGLEAGNSVGAGFRWTTASGFETVFEKSLAGELYPLEVSARIGNEVRIYFKPRLSFRVYKLTGPHITVVPYVSKRSFYPPSQNDYCTEWSLGIAGAVGANIQIFGWGASADLELLDWNVVLDEDCEFVEFTNVRWAGAVVSGPIPPDRPSAALGRPDGLTTAFSPTGAEATYQLFDISESFAGDELAAFLSVPANILAQADFIAFEGNGDVVVFENSLWTFNSGANKELIQVPNGAGVIAKGNLSPESYKEFFGIDVLTAPIWPFVLIDLQVVENSANDFRVTIDRGDGSPNSPDPDAMGILD